MAKSAPNGEKTPWKKEKLLVTIKFSFSHSVFKRLVLQTRENQGLFGNGLDGHYKGISVSQTQLVFRINVFQINFFQFKVSI